MPVNEQAGTTYIVKIADLANLDTFSNNAGGTIVLPGPALAPGYFSNASSSSGAGSTAAPSGTPFYVGGLIEIMATESDLSSPTVAPTGSGWTPIDASQNGAYAGVYSRLVPTGPFTSAYSFGTSLSWCDSQLFFGNCSAAPSVVQSRAIFSGGISGTTSHSAAFTNPVTAGNAILVVVTVTAVPYDSIHLNYPYTAWSVSDGVNSYANADSASSGAPLNDAVQQVIFLAQKVAGGTTTITVGGSTPAGHANGGVSVTAYEINLGTSSPVPSGFPAGWYCYLQNTGSGTFTVESSALIDGLSTPITLGPSQGTIVAFDGTNWFTERGVGGSSITLPLAVADGGTGTATPNLVAGSGISISGTWPDQTITATSGSGTAVPLWNYPPFSNGWAQNQTIGWNDGNMLGGTQNATYMVPFNLNQEVTASYLLFWVTTTGGPTNHYDLGIYDNSGNLVANIGAQALNTASKIKLAFTQGSVTFPPGMYWYAITSNRASGADFAFSGVDPNLYPSSGGGIEPIFIFVAAPGANPYGQPAWFQPASGGTTTGGALNSSVTLPTLAAINVYDTYEFFNNSSSAYIFPRFGLSGY
jgi:hypothetical protein